MVLVSAEADVVPCRRPRGGGNFHNGAVAQGGSRRADGQRGDRAGAQWQLHWTVRRQVCILQVWT